MLHWRNPADATLNQMNKVILSSLIMKKISDKPKVRDILQNTNSSKLSVIKNKGKLRKRQKLE